MFNLFKSNKVILNAYTDNSVIYNLFQFKKANYFYPKWWRNLAKPKRIINSPKNMKSCYGFLELYKKSFILPLWSDLIVEQKTSYLQYENNKIEKSFTVISPENKFEYSFHHEDQYKGMFDTEKYFVLKIKGPWMIDCRENVDFMVSGVFYNQTEQSMENDFFILPGLINFKYQNSSNFFVLFSKKQQQFFAPMPFVMITPLTERPVEINHYLDVDKVDALTNTSPVSFFNDFFRKQRIGESFESQCPFKVNK